MTDSIDLKIPDAAADGWFACGCSESGCVRAGYDPDVIPLIVAAELRRIAVEVAQPAGLISVATETGQVARNVYLANAAALRARAAELDGKGD